MMIGTIGPTTSGGSSATPKPKQMAPPIHAPAVYSAYRRYDFTRSSRSTRPAHKRRSARCSAVSAARWGGTSTIEPAVGLGDDAASSRGATRDGGTGDA